MEIESRDCGSGSLAENICHGPAQPPHSVPTHSLCNWQHTSRKGKDVERQRSEPSPRSPPPFASRLAIGQKLPVCNIVDRETRQVSLRMAYQVQEQSSHLWPQLYTPYAPGILNP
jgi:hypothetical protein